MFVVTALQTDNYIPITVYIILKINFLNLENQFTLFLSIG